jgi:hypothetical protein
MARIHSLMARRICGSNLRSMECFQFQIHDLDFGQNFLFIRGGKGGKELAYLSICLNLDIFEKIIKVMHIILRHFF